MTPPDDRELDIAVGGPVELDELYDLEELYDAATLSLIAARDAEADESSAGDAPVGDADAGDAVLGGDGASPPGGDADGAGPSAPARFRGARAAMLAGAMFGVAEVFEPEPEKQSVVEFAPAPADHHDDAIEFVFVRGAPQRSRIIYRPWL